MLDESFKAAMKRNATNGFLTAEEERDLYSRMQSGDPVAGRRFELSNLPLLVTVAAGELHRVRNSFELMDLVQMGYAGLRHAVNKFDPERGRFTTLATRCIKQAIRKEIARTTGTVRATHKARNGQLSRLNPWQSALIHCAPNSDAIEDCGSAVDAHATALASVDAFKLRQLVAALPSEQRALVHYVYFCGSSVKEAAEWVGLTPGVAKRRLTSALSALAEAIEGDPNGPIDDPRLECLAVR